MKKGLLGCSINYLIGIIISFICIQVHAQSVTITGNNSTTTNGITPGSISYGQNIIVLYGFTINVTGGSVTVNNFRINASRNWSEYFGSYSIVSCDNTNYTTGTRNTINGVSFNPSNGDLNISNFNQTITNGSQNYFLVANFTTNGTTNTNFQLNNINNVSSTPSSSPSYNNVGGNNFSIPPPTINITGLHGQGSANNGIAASSLVYGQNDIAFYGFQVSVTNAPTTINSMNFNVPPNGIKLSDFFGSTIKIVSCNSNNYATATVKNPVGTANFSVGGGSLNITNFNQSFAVGDTKYYFLVADYNTNGNIPTNPQFFIQYNTMNFTVGNGSTNSNPNSNPGNGNTFTLQPPVVTISDLNGIGNGSNGITATDISLGQNDIAIFGFSVKVSGASTKVTQINIGTAQLSGNIGDYFSLAGFRLYSTNGTSYTGETPQLVPGTSFAFNGSAIKITLSENFTANINSNTTQTKNYFLVCNYNTPGSVPGKIQYKLQNNNITYTTGTSGTSTTTTGGDITGQLFNMLAPNVTFTGINNIGTGTGGNGISATALYYGQTGVVVYGFTLTDSGAPVTVNSINMNVSRPAADFFINLKVYSSPTSVYNSATANFITNVTPAQNNNAFNITGFNQGLSLGETKYYFIVGDFSIINNTLPNTIKWGSSNPSDMSLSVTNATKSYSSVDGQTFSLPSPSVTISNYADSHLNPNNYVSINNQTYYLLGYNLTYSGPTNMHDLLIDVGFPAGGDNFTSGYISGIDVVDPTSLNRPSEISNVSLNGGSSIRVSYNNSPAQTGSKNYLLKVTFKNDGNHKPIAFSFCLNSSTIKVSDLCTSNSSCTIINNYNGLSTGGACSQVYAYANTYDWTGNGANASWSTTANWIKDGAPTSTTPSNNNDYVRIGYVKYTGSNAPQLNSSINIGTLEIGTLGSSSTSASPVTIDFNGKDININNGMNIDAGAILTLKNSASGTTGNLNSAGAAVLASTAAINFSSGTNAVKVNKTGGTFVLQSDASGTASIGTIPTNSGFTGNFLVQRYFKGGTLTTRTWRLLSSSVNNSTNGPMSASSNFNFVSLRTNLLVTGTGGSNNGFSQPNGYTANGPSILFYATSTGLFSSPTSTSSTENVGNGFYFYFRGDNFSNLTNKVIRSTTTGNYAVPEASVVAFQDGYLNQGPLTVSLSNAGNGYNLVGNPYPSTITMPSGGGTGTNATIPGTTNFVYTYSPGANSVYPTPSSTIDIASGQGFFLKALSTGPSAVNFTESLKTSAQVTGTNLLMSAPQSNTLVATTLEPSDNMPTSAASGGASTQQPMLIGLKMVQDTANYDVSYLRFGENYVANYDEKEDADDLNGNGQTVFFGAMTADKHEVAIASQPLALKKTSVFLSVNDNNSGTYSIKRMNVSDIPDKYEIWLLDHFKNDSLDLRNNDTYNFNLDKTNALAWGNSRFEVVIRLKSLSPYQLTAFTGHRTSTNDLLTWSTVNEYTYTSFVLQRSTDGINFTDVATIPSTGQGNYNYKDKTFTQDVFYRLKQTDINNTISYSAVIVITNSAGNIFTVYPNPVGNLLLFTLTQDVKNPLLLHIYNSTGVLVRSGRYTTASGQLDVSALSSGSYVVELINTGNNNTLAYGKFIKL